MIDLHWYKKRRNRIRIIVVWLTIGAKVVVVVVVAERGLISLLHGLIVESHYRLDDL